MRPFEMMGITLLAAASACGSETFDDDCGPGLVTRGTQCVIPGAPAGASGVTSQGGAGGQTNGTGGSSSNGGSSGAAVAGGSGSSGAPQAGSGGGKGAGAGGAASVGGAAGASGTAGAGSGGAGSGGEPLAGAGGSSGVSGGGSGLAGTAGKSAGGSPAGGGGGSAAGGATVGGAAGAAAGGSAGGSTAGGTAGGAAGAGGGGGGAGGGAVCDVAQCTAGECATPTCDGGTCGQSFLDAGTPCGQGGVCNGKGTCGQCTPGEGSCAGATPHTCGDDGQWLDGPDCALGCSGAGLCTSIVALASGGSHHCALTSEGRVRCWGGSNAYGELGVDGLPPPGTTEVQGIQTATKLVVGWDFSCVLLQDQTVWCWGRNQRNQLGQPYPATSFSSSPVEIVEAKGATAVFTNAAAVSACASMPGGGLLCWGDGNLPPTTLTGGANATAIGMSTVGPEKTRCIRQTDGALYCWGGNSSGQCGTGDVGGIVSTPTKVSGAISKFGVGLVSACSMDLPDGVVRCWGADSVGELGNGPATSTPVPTPQPVPLVGPATQLAVGLSHACAATGAQVYCWGGGSSSSPTLIENVSSATLLSAGNGGRACALSSISTVMCWTTSTDAQLVAWLPLAILPPPQAHEYSDEDA